MENIVEVKNLSKKYGRFYALSNISLSMPKGRIVGLIGPNGAGKTSFLKILSGLMLASDGDIYIAGKSLAANPNLAKENISIMLEDNPLPDHMRVGEYLRFRAALKGIKDIRKSTESIMRKCDLYYDARYKMIKNLSKGYRQRVGIADALLGNQPLVVLDEPTIGLDPLQIIAIRKTLLESCSNRTLLISSHILSELEAMCDYYIIINDGKIIASGTLNEITKHGCISEASYYVDIERYCSRADLGKFLQDKKLMFSIKNDASKNIYHVSLKSSEYSYQEIMHLFIDQFDQHLISFGKEHFSLKDAFLHNTKYRDENN